MRPTHRSNRAALIRPNAPPSRPLRTDPMRHPLNHAAALLLLPLLIAKFTLAVPPSSAPTPIPVAVPDRKTPVSYAEEVADLLDARCVGCHSSALAESKLSLEDVAGMLKGGKH